MYQADCMVCVNFSQHPYKVIYYLIYCQDMCYLETGKTWCKIIMILVHLYYIQLRVYGLLQSKNLSGEIYYFQSSEVNGTIHSFFAYENPPYSSYSFHQ